MSTPARPELPRLAAANASYVTERLLVGGDLGYDDEMAARQLAELVDSGVTHIIDCRIEADDEELVETLAPQVSYRWQGIDDAGQEVPSAWFDEAVGWVLAALEDPDAVVLTHCHMGINRGPSLGYAVLLAQGWDPAVAIARIRGLRPQAYVAYAEDALRWHHERTMPPVEAQRDHVLRLAQWRRDNEIDLVRIIAEQRAREV